MDLRDTEFMPSASPKKRHQFLCSTPRVTDEIGSTQNLLDRKQTSREAAMEKIEHARDMDSEGRTIGRTLLDNRNNHYETIDPDDLSKKAIHIEKDAMNSKKIATGISNTCEKGWQIFGDDCYEVGRVFVTFLSFCHTSLSFCPLFVDGVFLSNAIFFNEKKTSYSDKFFQAERYNPG